MADANDDIAADEAVSGLVHQLLTLMADADDPKNIDETDDAVPLPPKPGDGSMLPVPLFFQPGISFIRETSPCICAMALLSALHQRLS